LLVGIVKDYKAVQKNVLKQSTKVNEFNAGDKVRICGGKYFQMLGVCVGSTAHRHIIRLEDNKVVRLNKENVVKDSMVDNKAAIIDELRSIAVSIGKIMHLIGADKLTPGNAV
jgi:hypothetical protein